MTGTAFHLHLPASITTSVVFASPHSGCHYPPEFMRRTVLDPHAIRSSEDAFVDELIADAPRFGAPLLRALAPRAYVDLNRSADELDPALIDGVRRMMPNPRISSGLGVIPRVVANGRAIYRGKLSLAEAEARIAQVWRPYHATLQRILDEQRARFGEAILLDMHSMPHEAIESYAQRGRPTPEVVLGDRFGASAESGLMTRIEAVFLDAGFRTARNAPFAGAYIAQHYGRPSRQQHAIQIEIDRSLYMDERSIMPGPGFAAMRKVMAQVIAELADVGRGKLAMAAE